MDLDKQIASLTSTNNKQAYAVLKELLIISEKNNSLYSYFDKFVEMMNNQEHSYIRTRGLRLIAYNAKWDVSNQVNCIIEQWLNHIEDEKPITARQCVKDTIILAKNKPELIPIMLERLEKYNKIYEASMQSLLYKDRQKAIQKIKQYI